MPLAPLVIVSQLWLLVAVQVQPVPAVTLKVPMLLNAATVALAALSVIVQPLACVTVKVLVPTVIVAVRVVPVFDAKGALVAVLDVDSTDFESFDEIDAKGLESVCRVMLG